MTPFPSHHTMLRLLPLLLFASLLPAQTVDTLFYGDSPKLHRNPYGAGFIAGTNSYKDNGKYQRFDLTEPVHVIGAKLWMAKKRVMNTPDTVTIVLRRPAAGKQNFDPLSKGPGPLLASVTMTIDQFDTTKQGNVVLFPAPVNVNAAPDSLFIGIEWSTAADDTFALFADSAKQGGKANRAWERVSGYPFTYQRFNEPNDYSWLLDADLWIAMLYSKGVLSVETAEASPVSFTLEQNYPNPFNPATAISYRLSERAATTLQVYDALGRRVTELVNEVQEPGSYSVRFDAAHLSSGLYFYTLRSGGRMESRRMLLLK